MYKSANTLSAHHQECSDSTNVDARKISIVDTTNCVMSPITHSVLLYCRSLGLVMGQPLPMNGLVYGLMPTLSLEKNESIGLATDELIRLNIIDSRLALTKTGSDYLYKSINQADSNEQIAQCRPLAVINSTVSFHVETHQGNTNHV